MMNVVMVTLQAILFYGLLAIVIWKIARLESEARQIKVLIGELKKTLEQKG